MSRTSRALAISAGVITLAFAGQNAFSQTATTNEPAPERKGLVINVTANRVPTDIQRTGSAITMISAEEIEKSHPGSIADVLRAVPGLSVTQNGGPGSTANVRLRGANSQHTLVLIDGIRVNDPSDGSGAFDFANIAPALIDRIEVLRGPQSALYGSDAIGGVVNIITKRGRGPMTTFAQIEGGSYGSLSGNTGLYGAKDNWTYALALSSARSDGFSNYGYRVGRAPGVPASGERERDGFTRQGFYGRLGYATGNGFRFEIGSMATMTRSGYDAGYYPFFSLIPDAPSKQRNLFHSSFARAELDTFDNRVTHTLEVFANRTQRRTDDYVSMSGVTFDYNNRYGYVGTRTGVELRNQIRLDRFGSLILGARYEREAAETTSQALPPFPTPKTKDIDKSIATRSAFALWQIPILDRLDLSFGGRLDDMENGPQFTTWRATAAYRLEETGTKLRASAGTGAKAPTLYQLNAPLFGVASLQNEKSIGVDAGFDQRFLDGRITWSLTAFANRLNKMIDFEFNGLNCPGGLAAHPWGCYAQIARAKTSGVENQLRAVLWPSYVTLTASYTYLKAIDRTTGLELARRPQNSGTIGLTLTPFDKWTIEPSLTLVGKRFSSIGATERLAPYARLDTLVSWKARDNLDIYVRAENLTNARYQEVTNYGTTGRAFYAGMRGTW